jgi:hypothetical protein
MQIPEEPRKCVAFLGFRSAAGSYQTIGTAFFLIRQAGIMGYSFGYVVTAKHLIDEIENIHKVDNVCLRVNRAGGKAKWIKTKLKDWLFHPTDTTVDVSILREVITTNELDHLSYPVENMVSDESIAKHEIGIGDDVFLAGLFLPHPGEDRNIPIVRVGNIAAMPTERVRTEFGMVEAYLIEARSIGGLSGSPVFAYLGLHRMIKGQVMHSPKGLSFPLLGLMHAHFDIKPPDAKKLTKDELERERINMGIAVVIPASKILEIIYHLMVKKLDDDEEKELRERTTATQDSANVESDK